MAFPGWLVITCFVTTPPLYPPIYGSQWNPPLIVWISLLVNLRPRCRPLQLPLALTWATQDEGFYMVLPTKNGGFTWEHGDLTWLN